MRHTIRPLDSVYSASDSNGLLVCIARRARAAYAPLSLSWSLSLGGDVAVNSSLPGCWRPVCLFVFVWPQRTLAEFFIARLYGFDRCRVATSMSAPQQRPVCSTTKADAFAASPASACSSTRIACSARIIIELKIAPPDRWQLRVLLNSASSYVCELSSILRCSCCCCCCWLDGNELANNHLSHIHTHTHTDIHSSSWQRAERINH